MFLFAQGDGQDTMVEFCLILNWSLWWLYLGRWPTHDYQGHPYRAGTEEYKLATTVYWLAQGFCGIVWGLQGDLDWFHKGMRLENHSRNENPCCCCPAGMADPSWRDFRDCAAWCLLVYTAERWREVHPNPLPIFGILINGETILIDYMHVKYLGVDQYLFGSVLSMLVFHIMPGNPQQNMSTVFSFLQAFWQHHRTGGAFRLITINMFSRAATSQPKLRGRAGEIRRLAKALTACFKHYMDPEDELHKNVRSCLNTNCKLDDILDDNPGWRLVGEPYEQFVRNAHGFCCLYETCATLAAGKTWEMFDVTIKLHYLLHIAKHSKFMHPKLGWCWSGEHFMKITKQLLASCTRGSVAQDAQVKMVDKWCIALDLEYKQLSEADI